MPDLPFNTRVDRTKLFRDSGAEALLSLGKVLLDLAAASRRPPAWAPNDNGPVIGDLNEREAAVREFFAQHPGAKLRAVLLASPGAREIDPRVARVLGVLAAHHVLEGGSGLQVMTLARICCPGEEPAAVLEWRRVVAACGVVGKIQVAEDGGVFAKVMLDIEVLTSILGGELCVPVLSGSVFAQLAEQARSRSPAKAFSPKSARCPTDAATLVRAIPVMTPREIVATLRERGYVGQEAACRTIALAMSRHVRRLRKIHVDGIPAELMPRRTNILLNGPTGSGKTMIVETIAEILGLPIVVGDATALTETGYIGDDAWMLITRLIHRANGNVAVAEAGGIIAIDECDKLADVDGGTHPSRYGAQRSLLKLVGEPCVLDVPMELGAQPWRSRRVQFRTRDVMWFAVGVFGGLASARVRSPIGFRSGENDEAKKAGAREFERAGLMPELAARFGLHVALAALGREELRAILERHVRLHAGELEMDGLQLKVDRDVYDVLVDRAVARETGARGIHSELSEALNDAAYQAYSETGDGVAIRLHAADGGISWDVSKSPVATDPLMDLNEVNRIVSQTAETEAG